MPVRSRILPLLRIEKLVLILKMRPQGGPGRGGSPPGGGLDSAKVVTWGIGKRYHEGDPNEPFTMCRARGRRLIARHRARPAHQHDAMRPACNRRGQLGSTFDRPGSGEAKVGRANLLRLWCESCFRATKLSPGGKECGAWRISMGSTSGASKDVLELCDF